MVNSGSESTRPTVALTPEQREHFRRLADLADAERPTLPSRFRSVDTAAAMDTFSGALRRAIHASSWDLSQLQTRTSIASERLADFLEASLELSSSEIDTLVQTLGLELVKPFAPQKLTPQS